MLTEVAITLTEYSGPPPPMRRAWWRFWGHQEAASPYLPAKVRDDLLLLRAGLQERREHEQRLAEQRAAQKARARRGR